MKYTMFLHSRVQNNNASVIHLLSTYLFVMVSAHIIQNVFNNFQTREIQGNSGFHLAACHCNFQGNIRCCIKEFSRTSHSIVFDCLLSKLICDGARLFTFNLWLFNNPNHNSHVPTILSDDVKVPLLFLF